MDINRLRMCHPFIHDGKLRYLHEVDVKERLIAYKLKGDDVIKRNWGDKTVKWIRFENVEKWYE